MLMQTNQTNIIKHEIYKLIIESLNTVHCRSVKNEFKRVKLDTYCENNINHT